MLILVSCLMADPNLAFAILSHNPNPRSQSSVETFSPFQEQALVPAIVNFLGDYPQRLAKVFTYSTVGHDRHLTAFLDHRITRWQLLHPAISPALAQLRRIAGVLAPWIDGFLSLVTLRSSSNSSGPTILRIPLGQGRTLVLAWGWHEMPRLLPVLAHGPSHNQRGFRLPHILLMQNNNNQTGQSSNGSQERQAGTFFSENLKRGRPVQSLPPDFLEDVVPGASRQIVGFLVDNGRFARSRETPEELNFPSNAQFHNPFDKPSNLQLAGKAITVEGHPTRITVEQERAVHRKLADASLLNAVIHFGEFYAGWGGLTINVTSVEGLVESLNLTTKRANPSTAVDALVRLGAESVDPLVKVLGTPSDPRIYYVVDALKQIGRAGTDLSPHHDSILAYVRTVDALNDQIPADTDNRNNIVRNNMDEAVRFLTLAGPRSADVDFIMHIFSKYPDVDITPICTLLLNIGSSMGKEQGDRVIAVLAPYYKEHGPGRFDYSPIEMIPRVVMAIDPNSRALDKDDEVSAEATTSPRPLTEREIFERAQRGLEGPFGIGPRYTEELFLYLHKISMERREVGYQFETILLHVVDILTFLHNELGLDREIARRHPDTDLNELRWNILRGALSYLDPKAIRVAFGGNADAATPAPKDGQPLLGPLEALEEAIHILARNEHPRFKLPAFWDEEEPDAIPAIFNGAIHFILKEKHAQRELMNDRIDAKRIDRLHWLYQRLLGRITPGDDVLSIRDNLDALPAQNIADIRDHANSVLARKDGEYNERSEQAYRELVPYLSSQAPRLRELILQELQTVLGEIPVEGSFETLGDLTRQLEQMGISRLQTSNVLATFTSIRGAAHYPSQSDTGTLQRVRGMLLAHSKRENLNWGEPELRLLTRVLRTVYFELTGEARPFENAMALSHSMETVRPKGADWVAMEKPKPGHVTQMISIYYVSFAKEWLKRFSDFKFREWSEKEQQLHDYVIRKIDAMHRAIEASDYEAYRVEVEENLTYRWPQPAFIVNSAEIGRSRAKDMLALLGKADPADVNWETVQKSIGDTGPSGRVTVAALASPRDWIAGWLAASGWTRTARGVRIAFGWIAAALELPFSVVPVLFPWLHREEDREFAVSWQPALIGMTAVGAAVGFVLGLGGDPQHMIHLVIGSAALANFLLHGIINTDRELSTHHCFAAAA